MPEEQAHSDVIGGSSAERIMNCPGSKYLSEGIPNKSSKYADEGTFLHSVIARILDGEMKEDEYGYTELGYTYNADYHLEAIEPALEMFDKIAADFGDIDFYVENKCGFKDIEGAFGTVDVMGTIGQTGGYGIILDWKFGSGVPVSAKDNYQLKFYMAAALDTHPDMFEGINDFLLVIIQPRINDWS